MVLAHLLAGRAGGVPRDADLVVLAHLLAGRAGGVPRDADLVVLAHLLAGRAYTFSTSVTAQPTE
ncbi:hypothetical protein [Mycolicibacterium sp. CBMA 361]|uniref:hypothetical protein n=1 Tax=Mycolicibacterium sp. CBMA 361 TaxID=2606610 RepID=UPI0012DCC51F|nr:hypothetical protein [Mycolicibacterium sp. CBMA 361]